MTMQTQALLDRFHRALVAEIRTTRPEYLDSTFTVSEIYQNLVPYRSHRDVIGVEINGDYEDALLRLLGGEGQYLLIESDPARAEIQAELASNNPNTGLYREFAAVGVRLNPDHVGEEDASVADAEPEFGLFDEQASSEDAEVTAAGEDDETEQDEPALSENGRTAVATDESGNEDDDSGPASSADGTTSAPEACPACAERLPDSDDLRFCPYCGGDVRTVPCPDCGHQIEPDWLFCIACGSSAPDR